MYQGLKLLRFQRIVLQPCLFATGLLIYPKSLSKHMRKVVVWLSGEIKTPPFSQSARVEAGFLLGQLQEGELLSMPISRPMPSIGKHCHELRLKDGENSKEWRIIYRIDDDSIVIVEVFAKTTPKTPKQVIDNCQKRLKSYDELSGAG
jgi:phage-related protein